MTLSKKEPHPHDPLQKSLTPVPLSKGEGSDYRVKRLG
jgi:hypothetical protein